MDSEEIITLPQGQLKGKKRTTIYDRSYFGFEGIPYAKPPIGELRFKAPQPAEPWTGIKDCTTFASKPVQKNVLTGAIEGSEDCLYLNVYTPKLKSDKPLPVMVFIYGGGFYMGEATRDLYSPDYFMREDIVLVTFNYRLCSLGFLSLSDPELEVPGNAGLKDQILAIKWVNQYIKYFNGDTKNTTLFGESAGGASAHYMMCTEQTRGLFQKAIPMSGVTLHAWANLPFKDLAYRLALYNGYKGDNNDKLVIDYLRTLEPKKLVDHSLLTEEERLKGQLFPFGPRVEAYVGPDCVISKSPVEMMRTAWSNEIPIMIGGTSFEGLLMYPRLKLFPQSMKALLKNPVHLLPKEVIENLTDEEKRAQGTALVKLYFGDNQPSDENIFKFLDLYSYKTFWHGIHRTKLARLAYASAPTYYYRFDFDSPDFNHYRTKFCGQDPVRGVAHADDLSYLFFHKDSWKVSPDSSEYKTIQRMIGIWTSFAKNSDPNCSEIKPIVWKPVDKSNPDLVLNISDDVDIRKLPESDKLTFWDNLYKGGKLI